MYKVIRGTDYSLELWFVVDSAGNKYRQFNCWMDANNYSIKMNSIGSHSSNGSDVNVLNVPNIYSQKLDITYETIKNVRKEDFEKCFIDGAIYGYISSIKKQQKNISEEYDIIKDFAQKMLSKENVDEEIKKVISENFWDMV